MTEVSNSITIVGIVQGLFILALTVPHIKSSNSSFFAFMLMLVFVADLSTFYLYNTGLVKDYWYLKGVGESTLFLYGPVLYFYVSSILDSNIPIKFSRKLIHFVPSVVVFVLTSPLFFRDFTYLKLSEFETYIHYDVINFRFSELIVNHVIWYIHAIVYFLLCYRMLHSEQKKLRDKSIAIKQVRKVHFRWVQYLIIGYLIFPLYGLSSLMYGYTFGETPSVFSFLNIFLVFHIFCISYIGYTNRNLLTSPKSMLKYKESQLDEDTKKLYLTKLKMYFESKTPYLSIDLNLQSVANEIKISQHHISQVVNEYFGFGFNDFVNHHRIELAKKLIVSPEKRIYTIEAIANEVGFKSKPTFNTAFKKKEGITPSEFRKRTKIQL